MPDTLTAKATNVLDISAYGAEVKAFLANKEILAHIMKGCVEEYADCSIDDIVHKYIEGVPQINAAVSVTDAPASEGTALCDIRFFAPAPGEDGALIKLIISVDASHKDDPADSLTQRSIQYCCQMLSEEENVEFDRLDGVRLKKVCSISICLSSTNVPNSIVRFRMDKEDMIGHTDIDRREYDMMQVIMLRLGQPDQTQLGTILHILDVVFSNQLELTDKKNTLKKDYGIQMTIA